MSPQEVQERLKLSQLNDKIWYVVPSCATTGEGIFEGLVSIGSLRAQGRSLMHSGVAIEQCQDSASGEEDLKDGPLRSISGKLLPVASRSHFACRLPLLLLVLVGFLLLGFGKRWLSNTEIPLNAASGRIANDGMAGPTPGTHKVICREAAGSLGDFEWIWHDPTPVILIKGIFEVSKATLV